MILSWDLVAKLEVYILLDIFFKVLRYRHGRRKDFFQGGGSRGFSQNFSQGGTKSGEICFLPLEIAKTTFFC